MSEQGTVAHLAYDWMIVVYFFLGGLSAGTYFFSVAVNYWKPEFKKFAPKSALLSLIAIIVGMLILLYDLGQPFRAWRLFLSFNPRSLISWGVWFVNLFILLNLAYNFFIFRGREAHAKKFAYAGLPFALLTATYTGMLLAQAPGRIFWHTALIPVLFLNGAIISGIALVMLLSASERNVELLSKIGRLVAWLVILELGMILIEILILLNGGTESATAIKVLLSGQLGFLFIGIEIFLGAVIPAVLLLRGKKTVLIQFIASFLILIGIFTMRYVVVIGGQFIS